MDFRKLPSNSEGLLLKLVCSENPTQVLREQYNGLSMQQEQELDGCSGPVKTTILGPAKTTNFSPTKTTNPRKKRSQPSLGM